MIHGQSHIVKIQLLLRSTLIPTRNDPSSDGLYDDQGKYCETPILVKRCSWSCAILGSKNTDYSTRLNSRVLGNHGEYCFITALFDQPTEQVSMVGRLLQCLVLLQLHSFRYQSDMQDPSVTLLSGLISVASL